MRAAVFVRLFCVRLATLRPTVGDALGLTEKLGEGRGLTGSSGGGGGREGPGEECLRTG